ncbi:MAG: aldo/keto reductase [Thermoplasmata archaeon]
MALPSGAHLGSRVRTNQGTEIPWLGFGVFQIPAGPPTERAVREALDVGYRLIDTAKLYGNEADVGAAVRASGLPRDDVSVTTKLWHTDHGFGSALAAGRASLKRLGLDRIDLYLIHSPRAPTPDARLASWKALETLREEGACRAIGVSNYGVRHLEELRMHSNVLPAVNQVEMHPFVYDPELFAYCERHGIRLESYSPLTQGERLDDMTVRAIAAAKKRTPAQILIRWGLEHGLIEIPKTVHRARMAENAAVFDFSLDPGEMARLDGLRGGGRLSDWSDANRIP